MCQHTHLRGMLSQPAIVLLYNNHNALLSNLITR
jgi:hypothetical protein